MTTQIDWALRYHDAGWQVMPCENKEPLLRTWEFLKTQRQPREMVEGWWSMRPDAQIGVVTGSISGISVVDIDLAKDPITGKKDAKLGEHVDDLQSRWCLTVTSCTGGGGRQLFCRYSKTMNSTKKVHPQVDIKSDGGYVIVPESVHHETKSQYVWDRLFPFSEENIKNLAEFPEEFLRKAEEKVDDVRDAIRGVVSGSRNVSATKIIGSLLWRFEPEEIWPLLEGWNANNNPPLGVGELKNVFISIIKKHYATRSRFSRRNQNS